MRVYGSAWLAGLLVLIAFAGGVWWADGGGEVVEASGDITIDTVPKTASLDGQLSTVHHKGDHLLIKGDDLYPYYGEAQGRVIAVTLPTNETVIANRDADRSNSLKDKGVYVVTAGELPAGEYTIQIKERQMNDSYEREWVVVQSETVTLG